MTTCESALSLMEPYLDGELDASHKAEIEAHLRECPSCLEMHRRLSELGNDLRTQAPRYRVSEQLQQRVLSGVREAARSKPAASSRRPYVWAIAATVLLAVSAGWNLMLLRHQRNEPGEIAQEIVSSHVRSLMGTHLLDVISTDQHTVKPWFNGKLDYAPEVKDFTAAGFPLIGGRVDYIGGRPVAALVYKRGGHVINLFTWPSNVAATAPEAVKGFHLVAWDQNGMSYCAISDLNEAELRRFAELYH